MKEMTRAELDEWIKKAKFYQYAEDRYDDRGNRETSIIYALEGKFYAIEFCNGEPYEVWGEKGYKRGVYAGPQQVEERERTVTYWADVEELKE